MIVPTAVPYAHLPADHIGIQPPHHLAPGNVQIGAVTLQVAYLDRFLDFYTRVIGFSVHSLGEREGQRYATLSVPGVRQMKPTIPTCLSKFVGFLRAKSPAAR